MAVKIELNLSCRLVVIWTNYSCVIFFFRKEKNILLMHAPMIFGIDFENQPIEGAFVWYY